MNRRDVLKLIGFGGLAIAGNWPALLYGPKPGTRIARGRYPNIQEFIVVQNKSGKPLLPERLITWSSYCMVSGYATSDDSAKGVTVREIPAEATGEVIIQGDCYIKMG